MKRRIFLVGASGTGKSTLARAVADKLAWEYLPLSAGAAYTRHGATFASAEADPEVMQRVQTEICEDAAKAVAGAYYAGRHFVSDRGVDYYAYSMLLCNKPTNQMGVCAVILAELMKRADSAVFFCRPVPAILRAARESDSSRRSKFLTDEWVYRADGAILLLLRDRGIPFAEITGDDQAARVDTVVRNVGITSTGG